MNDRAWTGVVLAGGKSSRMGRDKALIEIDGISLLQRSIDLLRPHTREILVIADPDRYAPEHAVVVPDEHPGAGPLGGIITAMHKARYVRLLVLACDMPNLTDRLLMKLKNALLGEVDAVIPRHGAMVEPLAGAYHLHCIEAFQRSLVNGRLKMTDALSMVRTSPMDLVPGENGWPINLFKNLNEPADL